MKNPTELIGVKITIKFTDRSKSQAFNCTIGAFDSRNSIIYDQEGNSFLAGNSTFDFVKKGWSHE